MTWYIVLATTAQNLVLELGETQKKTLDSMLDIIFSAYGSKQLIGNIPTGNGATVNKVKGQKMLTVVNSEKETLATISFVPKKSYRVEQAAKNA